MVLERASYVKRSGSMLAMILFHAMISFSSFLCSHDHKSHEQQLMDAFIGCALSSIVAIFTFERMVENVVKCFQQSIRKILRKNIH